MQTLVWKTLKGEKTHESSTRVAELQPLRTSLVTLEDQ